MIHGHGGNIREAAANLGCEPGDITDMSSNINPLGPPPGLVEHLSERLQDIVSLPEVDAGRIVEGYAKWQGLDPGGIVPGNGTTQLLYRIPRALGFSRALIMAPTYSDYADACANNGVEVEYLVTEAAANFVPDMDLLRDRAKGVDGVFFCNPNNPTGVYTPVEEIEVVARDCPEATFIVDESYLPFVDGYGDHGMAERGLPNVVAMHSLSKMFCIPGLRIGLCHAPRRIAERLREYAEPWSVNTLAQEAVRFITGNPDLAAEHVRRTREYLVAEHAAFAEAFADARDITAYPGTATFVLFGLAAGTAAELVGDMLRERFLLRDCANFHGLSDGYFRVAFKSGDANRNIARLIARWAAGRSRVA